MDLTDISYTDHDTEDNKNTTAGLQVIVFIIFLLSQIFILYTNSAQNTLIKNNTKTIGVVLETVRMNTKSIEILADR